MEIIITALVLGFGGSMHCAGMCGPIAISLPLGQGSSTLNKISGALLYNLGRTLTYGVLGAIFGIVGEGFSLAGFNRYFSITMGLIMVISVFFPSIFKKINASSGYFSFMNSIKSRLQKLFHKQSKSSLFTIGLLNGLLPCGLVVYAIVGAIASGSIINSTLFMVFFGLATIPMLFAISMIGNLAAKRIRGVFNKLIPFIIVLVGLLFILRGLGLGIPYLSPSPEKLDIKNHQNVNPDTHDHCASVYIVSELNFV